MKRTLIVALALSLCAIGMAWAQPARCSMMQDPAAECYGCHVPVAGTQLSCHQQGTIHHPSLAADAQRVSRGAAISDAAARALPAPAALAVAAAPIAPSPVPSHAPPKRFLLASNLRL